MPRLFDASIALPADTKKLIERRQSGERLQAVYNLPGWHDIISILQDDIDVAEKKLRTFRDSDSQQALRLLSEMQGKADALKHLLDKVKSRIALIEDTTLSVSAYDNY